MDSVRIVAQLDFSCLEEDVLLVLAKACGVSQAVREILRRYYPWTSQLVSQYARCLHVGAADVEDEQQNAAYAIVHAIGRYDLTRLSGTNSCPFRTFLCRVVLHRLFDDARALWHQRAVEAPLTQVGADPGHELPTHVHGVPCVSPPSDPARTAEEHELQERVERALDGLDEIDRRLVKGVLEGRSIAALATELDLDYDQARRRLQRLLARLKGLLEHFRGEPD